MSPSTEHYDRTTKLDLYKQIETFREYVLIEQDRPRVEHWLRAEDSSWRQNVLTGLDATLSVEAVSLSVSLVDLYDRIRFTTPPVR